MSAKTSFYNLHVVIVSDDLTQPQQKYETRILPKVSETTSPDYIISIWNDMAARAVENNANIMVFIEGDCMDIEKKYEHMINGNLYITERTDSDSEPVKIQRDLHVTIADTASDEDNTQYKHIEDKITCANGDNSITKTLSDILMAIKNLDLSTIS